MDAEEVAAQLRCPTGEAGRQFGRAMNLRNLTMIVGALAELGIRDGDRILEPGCGDGGLLGYVLSMGRGLHYTGVELSAEMVAAAREFNAPFLAAGRAEYVLLEAAGGRLPLDDASFDRILSVNTIYFQEDLGAWLGELRRVMVPEGRLCLSFSERNFMESLSFVRYGFHLVDGDEVVEQAEKRGLRLLRKAEQRDLAVSKDGKLVERPFIHLVLEEA